MLRAVWIDGGREPQHPPDPKHPTGVDVDASDGKPCCQMALPYPARRCGFYRVHCDICGTTAIVTTAGRPDDPRSVKLSCEPTSRFETRESRHDG